MTKGFGVELLPLADGVLVLLASDQEFDAAASLFDTVLRSRPEAFTGQTIIVDVADRQLNMSEFLSLEALINHRLGVRVLQVVSFEAADIVAEEGAENGALARLAELGWQPPSAPAAAPATAFAANANAAFAASTAAAAAVAGPGSAGGSPGPTVLLRRTVRSGQRIAFDGNVVILGDVNPGAEIIASGDIVVVGTMRGLAHAGAKGSPGAVVAALALQPTQLRIGPQLGRPPAGGQRSLGPGRPLPLEVARLDGGRIVVEEGLRREAAWVKSSS